VRGGLALLAACCALAVALLLLAGCGGDAAPVSTEVEQQPTTPTLSAAEQARVDARNQRRRAIQLERTFAPNRWREPGTTPPHRTVLRRLIVHDVKRGKGPALRGGEIVYADFVKTFWRSGKKFLVAWGPLRAEYLQLPGQAAGMRRGMIGMRPGGRRTIAMPRAISDVHPPDGSGNFTAAVVDIVLRKIVTEE
jgi:FKBP-type peptidyl-prolyl cis-trans isomerase